MKQVLVIHGGDTYQTYNAYFEYLKIHDLTLESLRAKDWKSMLGERLGADYEVIAPRMPNSLNAQYPEWKLWFEKVLILLDQQVVLVGHSLGGTFLAKYLSENKVKKEILATCLVAACYDDTGDREYLGEFLPPKDKSLLAKQGGKIFLYHSMDDTVVPFSSISDFKKDLPDAAIRTFTHHGHFNQEEFPELVADIKNVF